MSGLNTRGIYDYDRNNEEYNRMTYAGNYNTNLDFYKHDNNCLGMNKSMGYDDNMQVDLDSTLKNINRVYSKASVRNIPESLNRFNNNLNDTECEIDLIPENSRYIVTPKDLKGKYNLRLDYPLYDPQCIIFEGFAIDTKLQAKDNHVGKIPRTFKQDTLMPNGYKYNDHQFKY